jgi:hypothetical protein
VTDVGAELVLVAELALDVVEVVLVVDVHEGDVGHGIPEPLVHELPEPEPEPEPDPDPLPDPDPEPLPHPGEEGIVYGQPTAGPLFEDRALALMVIPKSWTHIGGAMPPKASPVPMSRNPANRMFWQWPVLAIQAATTSRGLGSPTAMFSPPIDE